MNISTVKPQQVQPETIERSVRIKALAVHPTEKSGVFDIVVAARPLTNAEMDVLTKLFPHLYEKAEELLAKEALISSLVDRGEW